MSYRRWLHTLAFIPLFAIAVGCGSSRTDLVVDDRDRITPGGRISYEIFPGIDQKRRGTLFDLVTGTGGTNVEEPVTESRKQIEPTLSIDGEVSGVEGRDHRQIPAGESAELDVIIPGPERVKVNARNVRGHVAFRTGLRFFQILSLEGIVGVGLDSTEVRLRGGGSDTSDEDLQAGFLIGGRVTLQPTPLFDLYTQYTTNIISLDIETDDFQAGIELNITRNLSVFTGYRRWRYKEDWMASGSDVDLDIRGPTAGVSLKF